MKSNSVNLEKRTDLKEQLQDTSKIYHPIDLPMNNTKDSKL